MYFRLGCRGGVSSSSHSRGYSRQRRQRRCLLRGVYLPPHELSTPTSSNRRGSSRGGGNGCILRARFSVSDSRSQRPSRFVNARCTRCPDP